MIAVEEGRQCGGYDDRSQDDRGGGGGGNRKWQ